MKYKNFLYCAGLGVSLVCGTAAAGTLEGGVLGHALFTDGSRSHVDGGLGVAVDGLYLCDKYEGISARLSATALQTNVETDFQRYSATVGPWLYLDSDSWARWSFARPYVNAGIGVARQQTQGDVFTSDWGLSLDAAFGVVSRSDLLLPGLKWRAEVRAENDLTFGHAFDVVLGAGLHYSFGGPPPERSAAPVVRERPVRVVPPVKKPVTPTAVIKDSDGDGVPDDQDKCPGTPRGEKVDKYGCAVIESLVLKGVTFATGSAKLLPAANATLRSVAASMKASPQLKVEIGGYTDSVGTDEHNQALSQRRAEAVRKVLVKEGVAADRLVAKGYGKLRPIDSNDTAKGRANNRRVEFKVL